MADIRPVSVAPDLSLSQLNTVVEQQERFLGPLSTLGNDGAQTVLGFDLDPPKPTKFAVIKTGTSGGFCKGKIFISGQLQDAVATR